MNLKYEIDWKTIALYVGIVIFGWMNIYAANYSNDHAFVFDFSTQYGKQIIWVGIAFLIATILLFTPPRTITGLAYIIYGVIILLLVITIFIGQTTNGGHSWIDLKVFKLQPSEFAKFGAALALSKYVSTLGLDFTKISTWVKAVAILAVPALLIVLQHDVGSALVFVGFLIPFYRIGMNSAIIRYSFFAIACVVCTLFLGRFVTLGIVAAVCLFYLFVWLSKRKRSDYIFTIAAFVIASMMIFSVDWGINHLLEDHQRNRIYVLIDPDIETDGIGYNMNQSKIAIGSGGFFGKGYLRGTVTKARFVPEQETDFIFCTVGEEWGFLGCVCLLAAYFGLLYRLMLMAERQRSLFARFYGYSVTGIFAVHILVNVGMVLGLVPVIGIPLPFFSYGGSSLIGFTILLFIFIRQDVDHNQLL